MTIAAVFVKGGPDGNLYDYRPGGAMADTGLHAPINPQNNKFYGLSHITFCIPDPSTTTTTTVKDTTTTEPTTTTTEATTTTTEATTTTTEATTTTTQPDEVGEIVVQKVVLNGSETFEFTFDTVGFTLADNTLAHGQSSSSGDIAPGDGYAVSEQLPPGWTMVSAACDDGSPVDNIDVEAGETVTCTFTNTIDDEVQASILVQVTGTCVETDGEGEGLITVSMSVDGGAEVVIRNSNGAVVGTLSADGSITVPEGATYTWEATANEGFEFPEDADTSGSITIETCSEAGATTTTTIADEVLDEEVLPFTGIDTDLMAAYAAALLAGGLAMLLFSRRAEES